VRLRIHTVCRRDLATFREMSSKASNGEAGVAGGVGGPGRYIKNHARVSFDPTPSRTKTLGDALGRSIFG